MDRRISTLSLQHFRLIAAIAELQHLSRAAGALGITQPSASRLLAEAEGRIGLELFTRHAKGMAMTEAGEAVAGHALRIVAEVAAVTQDVDARYDGRRGTLRVGAVTGPAIARLVPAIRALKAEGGRIDVTIDVAPSDLLVSGLLQGDYDLVLARIPPDITPAHLNILPGRNEQVRLLVRQGHPLASDGPAALPELQRLTWVMQRVGLPIRIAVEHAFLVVGLPVPRDVINTASLLVTLAYLRQSDAIAPVVQETVDLLNTANPNAWVVLETAEEMLLSPYYILQDAIRPASPTCVRLMRLL